MGCVATLTSDAGLAGTAARGLLRLASRTFESHPSHHDALVRGDSRPQHPIGARPWSRADDPLSNRSRRRRAGGYVRIVWFGVLGHLEVQRGDGATVSLPGPARRKVLAALLCRVGRVVSASALIDDLSGAAAPRSAAKTLQSHIVRLRHDLAAADGAGLLVTEPDGYRLAVVAEEVDSTTFESLAQDAASACEAGNREAALALYDRALGLWRDEAYLDFGDAPFAVSERIRLSELRSRTAERRVDLAMDCGRAEDLIADLEQRVRAEPYRERGWEQVVLALYRAGRQADALGAYRRARTILAEDLGIDPGPGLRELETGILRQDPNLFRPRSSAPAVATTVRLGECPYLGLAS